jgi:hypothetical protein
MQDATFGSCHGIHENLWLKSIQTCNLLLLILLSTCLDLILLDESQVSLSLSLFLLLDCLSNTMITVSMFSGISDNV